MTPSPSPDRRAIGVIGAYVEGWRRVLKAPAVWIGLLAVSLVTGFAPGPRVDIRYDADLMFGYSSSLEDEGIRIARLVTEMLPRLIDPSTGVVDAVRLFPPRDSDDAPGMAAGVTWRLFLYVFLWCGVLDRLARARPVGSARFFAACGAYLWRFLRLAVPLGLAYWLVARVVWPDVGQPFSPHPVAEFVALVVLLIVAGFTKVRMIVEDRQSALGSLLASVRFVRRRPVPILALVLLNLCVIALFLALGDLEKRVVSVLPLRDSLGYVWFFVSGLLWQWALLAFAASEIVYFQHALAHAAYTAAPLPIWPDSPAAEAIENLVQQRERSGPGA